MRGKGEPCGARPASFCHRSSAHGLLERTIRAEVQAATVVMDPAMQGEEQDMVTNLADIHRGMEVFAVDGELIGTVLEVRPPRSAGDAFSVEPEMPAGGSVAPNTEMIGGQPITGPGGIGPLPTGTTTDKDRGTPNASSAAAERGDIRSISGEQQGTVPGSGGEDALRGYGSTGDESGVPLTAGATAEGLENLRGGGGDLEPNLRATAETGPGYIMVEDRGVMGVGAGGLRIPTDAVLDVMPGRRVTLDCTREQARNRYGPGPSLDIDENAPVTPF